MKSIAFSIAKGIGKKVGLNGNSPSLPENYLMTVEGDYITEEDSNQILTEE